MKKVFAIIVLVVATAAATGCAPKVVTPVAPSLTSSDYGKDFESDYRKTIEVVAVDDCQEVRMRHKRSGQSKKLVQTVETTKSGQRFQVNGCFGEKGDRFRISY